MTTAQTSSPETSALCSQARHRRAFAQRIQAMCAKHNVPCTIDLAPLDARGLDVEISIGGYACRMTFSASMAKYGFIAHWYTNGPAPHAMYPSDFGIVCRGSVNTYHYGKATTFADTFKDLRNTREACILVLLHDKSE